MNMTREDSVKLAQRWIDAWNGGDLEQVLELYDDDTEMVSPVIVSLGINDGGRLRGKPKLRAYWSRALADHPDLRFTLLEVFSSPDSIIVRYSNERGNTMCEYLRLGRDGRIVQGSANHLMRAS